MNSSLLVIVLTLIIFVAILIVLGVLRKERVDPGEIRRKQLGFHPLESAPQELLNRIRALQHNDTANLQITRISQKKTLDGDLYLYDGVLNSDMKLEDRLVAVSSFLRLPHFTLMQMPDLDDRLGNIMNRLADSMIGWASNFRGLQRVHLTAFPEFDRKFILLAENQEEAEAFFNAERVQIFTSLDAGIAVDAFGDSLQITRYGKHNGDTLNVEIATAIKLMHNLCS